MSKSVSPLDQLAAHFASFERRQVTIQGLSAPIFFAPLNGEQAIKVAKASQEKNPKEQARLYAETIVEVATLEDGKPAFPLEKGGENPVKVLTTGIPPRAFTALCSHLIDGLAQEAAEELEKK